MAPVASPSATPTLAPTTSPTPHTGTRVVFIGDSYTAGTGASTKSKRWTTLVSKKEKWTEINLGLGGTGYLTTASTVECGQTYCANYAEVAETVGEDDPDYIVVSGGQNDFAAYADDPTAVEDAVKLTFTTLKETAPRAKIIAVGPTTPAKIDASVRGLAKAVQDTAKANGAQYINLLDPPVVKASMIVEAGGHVNDDGHEAIADRVVKGLKKS